MTYKRNTIFSKFDKHSRAYTTSEQCLGTLGDFEKSHKNIYKLDRHSRANTTA